MGRLPREIGSSPIHSMQGDVGNVPWQIEHPKKIKKKLKKVLTILLKNVILNSRSEGVGNARSEPTSRASKTETDKDTSPHGHSGVRYTNVNQNHRVV